MENVSRESEAMILILRMKKRITLKKDRLDHWVSQGAQLSERVKLLHKYSLDPNNLQKRQKNQRDFT